MTMTRMRTDATAWIVVAAVIAIGTWCTIANRRLPLVRNSLVYATAAANVIAHGYDPRPVVADSRLSYDKPILYSWMSSPLVARLGAHDGLRLTSWAGTVAYLLAVLVFANACRSRLPERGGVALVWLSAFGPCVIYQFWSAHPDSWFAALILCAWALAMGIVGRPDRTAPARIVLLGVVIAIALLMKNYALVLGLSCPLYFLWHLRALRASDRFRAISATTVAVFAVLGVLVLLAWTGHNPFSRLEGEGGGVDQYGRGVFFVSARGTWVQIGIAVLLQAQVALVFALRRKAWARDLTAPLVLFGLIYCVALMPFPTTFYNMRYFLPLFPLVGLVLARGAAAAPVTMRRAVWSAHAMVGAALILIFNVVPVYRLAAPAIPDLTVDWIGTPLSLLDNLRMKQHLDQAAILDRINASVPPGGTIYMLDVNYYRDAEQHVFERDGLIRGDVTTRYVTRRTFRPTEPEAFVWSYSGRRPTVPSGARITDLGDAVYRIDRQ